MTGKERIEAICKSVPDFKVLYNNRVRHYIIKDHILNVYNQFEQYFKDEFEESEIEDFRLFLFVHDIGKSSAYKKGNKDDQYVETIELISKHRSELELSDNQFALYKALLNSWTIGKYMENKISLDETYNNIVQQAKISEISVDHFFYLLSVYYQCDVASYTKDAGGLPFLENLFEYQNGLKNYCKKTKLLKLSDRYSQRYNVLFNKIDELSKAAKLQNGNSVSTKNIQLKVVNKIDLSKFEKPKKEIKENKENLYVIDTNVFVDFPDIISKIKAEYPVILSAKVVDELDNLKSRLNYEGKKKVQRALKFLNKDNHQRDIRMELSDLSLLPPDFDQRSPDNMILSVSLKYASENPILLTSDNGLQLKAKSLKITTIKLKEFLGQLKMR